MTNTTRLWIPLGGVLLLGSGVRAQGDNDSAVIPRATPLSEKVSNEKGGFLSKLFQKQPSGSTTAANSVSSRSNPDSAEPFAQPIFAPKENRRPTTALLERFIKKHDGIDADAPIESGESAEALERLDSIYPDDDFIEVNAGKMEFQANEIVEDILKEFEARIGQFNDPELSLSAIGTTVEPVPHDFTAEWRSDVSGKYWRDQPGFRRDLTSVYSISLSNSTRVRSFSRIPLIREANIQEAYGVFDLELFGEVDIGHTDEPTGSILTTGETGRFLQDQIESEYGVRRRLTSGADVRLSQRLSTLDNNSEYLDPNPQSGSEVVLSLVQPILRGGGYDYNKSELRIAVLDRDVAAVEFLRLVEDHLLEINRAYWGVYLSRAAWLQRKRLLDDTSEILDALKEREELDDAATSSELYRAQAALNRRKAELNRSRMAIRSSEQRLRAMINDPAIPMGAAGEIIPSSKPIVSQPQECVQDIARNALRNRSEMIQAMSTVRAAAIRRNQAYEDLKPQLDLIGEVGWAGIDGNRSVQGAIDDMTDHGTEWSVGIRMSVPVEKNLYNGRLKRYDLEFQQRSDDLRIQAEDILLDTLISYQNLINSYHDMSGKYQSVLASRTELRQLRDRMKLEDEAAGRSIAYHLQLILDAMDRNQVFEEEFLVSVVTYNTAIARVHRVRGKFLQYQNVEILRQDGDTFDELQLKIEN